METSQILFAGKSALRARAFLLGERFDLRTWPEAQTIHRAPLAVKLDGGMAVLFRYGVAVLPGASPDAERALRERLSARTENPYEALESEELDIRIDPARPEGLQEGELVARTERTIVDLISTEHSLRVEWYIVSLIVLEILLTIYQLWLQ